MFPRLLILHLQSHTFHVFFFFFCFCFFYVNGISLFCSLFCFVFFSLNSDSLGHFPAGSRLGQREAEGLWEPWKRKRERECVRVLGVERTPHRSLCTVGGKPGREAPFISSQRTVVSVFRLELCEAETTPACLLLYTL